MFIAVCFISYITAPWFGTWYDKISPQSSSYFWGLDEKLSIILAGIIVSYTFFIPFIFEIFGSKEKKIVMSILILPAIYLWLSAEKSFIYIPILLIISALLLANLLRYIYFKVRG
jgi:hypothetical protein